MDSTKPSLHIWSVGGHERYRPVLTQFYSGVSVAILCFDLLNLATFNELGFWYNEVKRNCPDALLYLVGTKMDEPEGKVVKIPDAIKLV
ncbi:P-loop containing nucleoside triphosphate hydrolase protein [Gorgonomyces haynaldii]|nr:P-loop containing nucleoside triphosphate hydrolase protein [Gorgonomyces haynaldii]